MDGDICALLPPHTQNRVVEKVKHDQLEQAILECFHELLPEEHARHRHQVAWASLCEKEFCVAGFLNEKRKPNEGEKKRFVRWNQDESA